MVKGRVWLDDLFYIQFEKRGALADLGLYNSHKGEVCPDLNKKGEKHKRAGEPVDHENYGWYPSILAAIKDYVNHKVSDADEMDAEWLLKELAVIYEAFNDYTWLDLLKEIEPNA